MTPSFVDTTLPPGYDLRRWCIGNVVTWRLECRRDSIRRLSQDYGDSPEYIPPYLRRVAWRHWTAAVLRGRRVTWAAQHVHGKRRAYIGDVTLDERFDTFKARWYYVLSCDYFGRTARNHADIDEAMARFAALVLALDGMPQ